MSKFNHIGYDCGCIGKRDNHWCITRLTISASDFNTRGEWKEDNNSAYQAWRRFGMPESVVSHMIWVSKPYRWDLEEISESARKHNSRSSWCRSDGGAYNAWLKKGKPESVVSHMVLLKDHGKWTLEEINKSARKYCSKSEWNKNDPCAYDAWLRNGCKKNIVEHMLALKVADWTIESLSESAKKYNNRRDWHKKENGAYQAWLRMGSPQEIVSHMTLLKARNKWDISEISQSAKKYNNRRDWQKKENGAYQAWLAKGKPESVVSHMKLLHECGKLTEEVIAESAQHYSSRSEWERSDPSAYNKWLRNGRQESVVSHMEYGLRGYNSYRAGFLYVLEGDIDNSIVRKYGITNNPEVRHKQLNISTPFKFQVVHCFKHDDGSIADAIENIIHDDLKENRAFKDDHNDKFDGYTEWFVVKDNQFLESVIDLCEQAGMEETIRFA